MGIEVDSDVLIDLLRGKDDAVKKIGELEKNEEFAATDINIFESYFGAYNSNKKDKNLSSTRGLLKNLTLLHTTEEAIETGGRIYSNMKAKGKSIDCGDILGCVLFFDGACRGNPGPMGMGAVLLENGKKVKEISKRLGKGTNNIAEWSALIEGMKMALAHGCRELEVLGDSQLIIRQITGRYRVKSGNLIPLYHEAKRLSAKFENIRFKWLNRDKNVFADALSNQALDGRIKVEKEQF